jgi:hypothetical protein
VLLTRNGKPQAASEVKPGVLIMFDIGGETHIGMKGTLTQPDGKATLAASFAPGFKNVPAVFDWNAVGGVVYELPNVRMQIPIVRSAARIGPNFDRRYGVITARGTNWFMVMDDPNPRFPDIMLNLDTGVMQIADGTVPSEPCAWFLGWKVIYECGDEKIELAKFDVTL